MHGHALFLTSILAALALAANSALAQETVSREAPPDYELVQQLLTPIESVLENAKPIEPNSEDSSRYLLREEVRYIQPDGRALIVDHRVMRADLDSGVGQIAEMQFGYAKDLQTIHLVKARAIQPDGTEHEVRENAAFLSSPQLQAQIGIYDDLGILTVIYPQVKVGTVTESIVVYDMPVPRVPGEFRDIFTIRDFIPQDRVRFAVDLPSELAERVKITTVGPETKRGFEIMPETAEGRTRWVFELENARKLAYEPRAPRAERIAGLWLSTFDGWDGIGRWYAGLTEGRSELGPELKAKLDEWAPEGTGREETIRRLLSKVSNEIRYTGLEFGLAALQPRDCNEVFENGYGDCKDKSNLLKALLAARGIESRLVLIDTEFGAPVRESPDYRQFNHCILAIAGKEGGWTFCDPTVEGAMAGLLPQQDRNREVLIIGEDGAEWATTPAEGDDAVVYRFELEIDHDGRISGWLDFEATGFLAGAYAQMFEGKTDDERRDFARMIAASVYEMSATPDVELPGPEERDPDKFTMRAYLVTGGSQMGGVVTGGQLLNLPFPANPDLGFLGFEGEQRESPFPVQDSYQKYEGTIKLPEGVRPVQLPNDFVSETKWSTMRASWEFEDGVCSVTLEIDSQPSVVPAPEFEQFRQADNSFMQWLNQPISLQTQAGAAPLAMRPGADPLGNFPTLSNGMSQLALVESLFPEQGNRQLRRLALERTASLFPDDKLTIFTVGANLAVLDSDDDPEAGVARMEPLLRSFRAAVPHTEFAYGRYTLALCLESIEERGEECLKIYQEIVEDEELPDETRVMAAFRGSVFVRESGREPEVWVDQAEAALDLESLMQAYLFGEWASLKVRLSRAGDVLDWLKAAVEDEDPYKIYNALDGIEIYAASPEIERRELLVKTLELLGETGAMGVDERVAQILEAQSANVDAIQIATDLQTELRESANRFPSFSAPRNPALQVLDREVARQRITQFEAQFQPLAAAQHAVALLIRFDVDDSTMFDALTAVYQVNWLADQGAGDEVENLVGVLTKALRKMPKGSDYWHEGIYIEAYARIRRGEPESARQLLEAEMDQPYFHPLQITPATFLIGRSHEKEKNVDAALAAYEKLKNGEWSGHKLEAMIYGAFLAFHAGRIEEAASFVQALNGCPPEFQAGSDGYPMIQDVIKLVASGHHEEFWAYTEKWWPEWKKLEAVLTIEPAESLLDIPSLPNSVLAISQMQNNLGGPQREMFHDVLRRFVAGARFNPAIAGDLYQHFAAQPVLLTPTERRHFQRLMVAIGEDMPLPGTVQRQRGQLIAALTAVQLRDGKKAAKVIETYEKELEESDVEPLTEVVFSMAMAKASLTEVTGKGQPEAAEEIHQLLETNDLLPERFGMVSVLIGLHEKIDDDRPLIATIEREMNHPAIRSNPAWVGALRRELEKLSATPADSAGFHTFAANWIAENQPGWYEFAKPKDLKTAREWQEEFLEDERPDRLGLNLPRIPELDGGEGLLAAEEIKTLFLVSLDEEAQLADREDAFLQAALRALDLNSDREIREARYEELLAAEAISLTRRQNAMRQALIRASITDPDFHKFLLTLPLAKGQTSFLDMMQRNNRKQEREVVESLREKSAGEIGAEIDGLFEDEKLNALELQQFGQRIDRLLEIGAFDEAQEFADKLKNVDLPAQSGATSSKLRLMLRREISTQRKAYAFHEKARDMILEVLPERPETEPIFGDADDPLMGLEFDDDVADQFPQLLAEVHDSRHPRWPSPVWTIFLRGLVEPAVPEQQLLAAELYELGLAEETPGPSDQFSNWAMQFDAVYDPDDPATRERAFGLIDKLSKADWLDASSRNALLVLQARMRFFAGETEILPAAALAKADAEVLQNIDRMVFVNHILHSEEGRLREFVEGRDLDEMLEDHAVATTFRAFAKLGMDLELELVQEHIEERLYELILDAWSDPDSIMPVAILGDWVEMSPSVAELIPEGFDEGLDNARDRNTRWNTQGELAIAAENWERLAEVSQKGIDEFPTFIIHHWHRARAAYHLGDHETARERLEHIEDRCHGRFWRVDAMKMLEEIRKK